MHAILRHTYIHTYIHTARIAAEYQAYTRDPSSYIRGNPGRGPAEAGENGGGGGWGEGEERGRDRDRDRNT